MSRALAASALALLLVAACGVDSDPVVEPVETPAADAGVPTGSTPGYPSTTGGPGPTTPPAPPTPSAAAGDPSYSDWKLGARVLPLRRTDRFGQVRPTPPELRNRKFATPDVLPPPQGGGWESSIGPVTPEIRQRMGTTWSRRCPVTLAGLRYLTVSFRGFDGEAHTGELVVAASEAEDVASVFRALFEADFPIEEMRLVTTTDMESYKRPTGDGNNTAAMVCRRSTGQSQWSAHAYAMAIDLNPFMNPYQNDDLVLPELASAYLDRSWVRPGMILADSAVVREFARIGWSWGGAWRSLKDYQHFSALHR